jgi:hypothetical protein
MFSFGSKAGGKAGGNGKAGSAMDKGKSTSNAHFVQSKQCNSMPKIECGRLGGEAGLKNHG